MSTDRMQHQATGVHETPPISQAGDRQGIDHPAAHGHRLRFDPLFGHGRSYAFPCDVGGGVYLDALTERGRYNYLFARAMVGRDFATPIVEEAGPQLTRQ